MTTDTYHWMFWETALWDACHRARLTGTRHRVYRGRMWWHAEPVTVPREVSA